MLETFQRECVSVGVVDDDAGDAVAIREQAAMKAGGHDQIVPRINLMQVLIKRRVEHRDSGVLQQMKEVKVLGLVMSNNLDLIIPGEVEQDFQVEIGDALVGGLGQDTVFLWSMERKADAFDPLACWHFLDVFDGKEGGAIEPDK